MFKYIANQLIDPEEEIGLRDLFSSMDEDGNGTLSRDEFREGVYLVSEHFQLTLTEDNFEQILQSIDLNQNGTIDYQEFITASVSLKDMADSKGLFNAFQLFDIDKDGIITQKELKRIMGPILNEGSQNLWLELLEEHDKNKDGVIDFEEFKHMIVSLLKT